MIFNKANGQADDLGNNPPLIDDKTDEADTQKLAKLRLNPTRLKSAFLAELHDAGC